MAYLLGLDIGTSGVKALLVTSDGEVVGSVTVEYPFYSPRPGWSEQYPEDMWQGTVSAISQVLDRYQVKANQVMGLGLSGQMHSAVFLDNNGQVIRPAILWNDSRTTAQCRRIEELVGKERLLEEACNPALEGFTAPKVLWLRENEPENYHKLHKLVLVKDYIRYRLTGELKMEVSDAAGTLLFNVRQGCWSQTITKALDIREEILPPIMNSAEVGGHITDQAARETRLPAGIPVVGGGADNACGAVGAGVVKAGRGMLSLGTSGVMLAHLDQAKLITSGTVHMFNSAVPNQFYMMGVMLSSGLSFRWFRDQLGHNEQMVAGQLGKDSYQLLTDEASRSKVGSNGLYFLPYLSGERTPHADGNLRGGFLGLSASNTRSDMIRAILEGVGYSFMDALGLLRQAGWDGDSVRAIGGGSKSPLWREIISSITGLKIERINIDEGPSYGAALLAGVGTGCFKDLGEAADARVKTIDATEPNPDWHSHYQELYAIYQDMYPALKPLYDRLALI